MAYFLMYLVVAAITLILLVPFGMLVMYAVIALRQMAIASKEHNVIKRKGAQKALLVSVSGMLLVILIGVLIMLAM